MVRNVERISVYLKEEPPATVEAASNIAFRNTVATSGDARANAGDREISGREFDKVEHRPETNLRPATKLREVTLRRQSGLDGERFPGALSRVKSGDQLAGGRSSGRKLLGLPLDLVGIQEGHARMEERNELSSEGSLARTVGTRNQDGDQCSQ
jgi:hypothetical protein